MKNSFIHLPKNAVHKSIIYYASCIFDQLHHPTQLFNPSLHGALQSSTDTTIRYDTTWYK